MDPMQRFLLRVYRSRESISCPPEPPRPAKLATKLAPARDERSSWSQQTEAKMGFGLGCGIVSVIGINGNGFYPANSRIKPYLTDDAKVLFNTGNVESKNEKYPIDFVLIGWQMSENRCYYQQLTIESQPEKTAMFEMAKRYATIIYAEHFKKTTEITSNWILNILQIDKLKEEHRPKPIHSDRPMTIAAWRSLARKLNTTQLDSDHW
jgi:hypothetical protein